MKLLQVINKIKNYKFVIINNKQNKKIYKIIISAKESTYFFMKRAFPWGPPWAVKALLVTAPVGRSE